MAMYSSKTVLVNASSIALMIDQAFSQLTGENGHFGSRVVVSALNAGYAVRGTVRRSETALTVLNAKPVQPYRDHLELVTVNHILADGAIDEAVQGIGYILHIPSRSANRRNTIPCLGPPNQLGVIARTCFQVSTPRIVSPGQSLQGCCVIERNSDPINMLMSPMVLMAFLDMALGSPLTFER
jgi:hypothetical protein